MNEQTTEKRNTLVGAFVLAGTAPIAIGGAQKEAQESQIHSALYMLIFDYGHDVETHSAIIGQLDGMYERRPEFARSLTYAATTHANVNHFEGDSAQANRAALESKLALLWRHMLMNDNGLTYEQKLKEAGRVQSTAHMSSTVLVTEARNALTTLRENPVYALQPW